MNGTLVNPLEQTDSFRDLVDRDIRGRTSTEEATHLRSSEIAERWLTTLLGIQKSVEGQLATRHEEFLAERAKFRRLLQNPSSKDLLDLKNQYEELQESYSSNRAKKLRFKTGLDESIVEAQATVDKLRGSQYDSIVSRERNYYAEQRTLLEEAIRQHQTNITTDDIEPSEYDEELWETLTIR